MPRRVVSLVAVVSSIVLPISVGLVPSWGGVLQRLMFAIAFAWFIIEAAPVRTWTGQTPGDLKARAQAAAGH